MRAATRLLANVKYLQPGAPTGLTGIRNHPAPRSALLFLYHSTLDKLKRFPEHSVYRQSVEALTKHRLSIVESVKPEGLESWQERVRPAVEANPEAFRQIPSLSDPNVVNIVFKETFLQEFGSEAFENQQRAEPEGPRTIAERAHQGEAFSFNISAENAKIPRIEAEPRLNADQIETIEQQVGAGLIEEIIEVAEGEHKLVDEMFKNEVWSDLVETPVEGQWTYHEIK